MCAWFISNFDVQKAFLLRDVQCQWARVECNCQIALGKIIAGLGGPQIAYCEAVDDCMIIFSQSCQLLHLRVLHCHWHVFLVSPNGHCIPDGPGKVPPRFLKDAGGEPSTESFCRMRRGVSLSNHGFALCGLCFVI